MGQEWDLGFCSDMLGLADFLALSASPVRDLPFVAYYHENQITYPVRHERERDYHFAFSNMSTALAAERVWFNSAFHMQDFLDGLTSFLNRMPDYQPIEAVEQIRNKSEIRPPGIESGCHPESRKPGPPRILWAARWEYDKAPQLFFEALALLKSQRQDFEISVIGGGNAREVHEVFSTAREKFAGQIRHWGYRETYPEYLSVLADADIVVSTANHEFFGISLLEAMAAGAFPLVPRKLSYPEILADSAGDSIEDFFYNGTVQHLSERLNELVSRTKEGQLWQRRRHPTGSEIASRYLWDNLAPQYDLALEKVKKESERVRRHH